MEEPVGPAGLYSAGPTPTGPVQAGPIQAGPHPASLRSALPLWGLLGWGCLFLLGQLLVLPAPWTYAGFARYIWRHVSLADGLPLSFAGKAREIWLVALLLSLVPWLEEIASGRQVEHPLLLLACLFVDCLLSFFLLRWLVSRIALPGGRLAFVFTGGFWPFLGWNLLLGLSCLTIIGWAWVLKGAWRWTCRHIEGDYAWSFAAGGWAILWRSLVCGFLCLLIIPIPWVGRWYLAWLIGEIELRPRAGLA